MTSVAHIIRRRRTKRSRKRVSQDKNRMWGGFILLILGVSVILPLSIVIGVTGFLYAQASSALPSPASTIYLDPIVGSTELYDRNEQELLFSVQDPLGDSRVWIELSDLPPYVIDATLLMEDSNFLQVTHFDAAQTFNNLWWYIIGTPINEDQSITGRLVRNAILPSANDRSLDVSLVEIVLVSEINRLYTPEAVLEWHLNTNYYGNDAYGIEAAAQVYLGKSASDLTLDEAAMLAAVPTEPQYNPFDNETAARGRQADLLQLLLNNGRITQLDYDAVMTRQTPLRTDLVQVPRIAPEFSVFARQQTEDILDSIGLDGARMVARDGLRIVTTLDLDLYYQSECVLKSHLATWNAQLDDGLTLIGDPCISRDFLETPVNLDTSLPPSEGSIVILDVHTGAIRSMIGTVDRPIYQPGPTIHPFVYFEGFRSAEFTPASMVMDIPQAFPGPADGLIYTPTNIDGQFRGPINLRDAMVANLLPPAVHVANSRGLSRVWATAHRIGLNTMDETEDDLSLLEQGGNVSVLDIAYTYSVFASMGTMRGVDVESIARGFRSRDPVAVLRIEDAEGNIIWEYAADAPDQIETSIFAPSLGYLVNNILSDNTTRNAVLNTPDSALSIGRPVAVVHGNTRDLQDNWTVGYTPQFVTAVHLGSSADTSMSLDVYGLQGAAPIWQALMRYVHQSEGLPPEDWQRPADIAEFVVCDKSGLLPGSEAVCPTRSEVFIANIPPLQADSYWQQYELNSQTRQLATANTPSNLRTEFVFFVPPQSAMEWWQSNGLPLPPTEYDTLSRPELLRAVQLLQPDDFAYVGGTVDVRASIETEGMESYQLAYGEDINPTEWFEIGGQQQTFTEGTSIGMWDTSALDGVFTLRLTVVYEDGSIDNDFRMVTVDNQPPVVEILAGTPGQVFRFPADGVIPLAATVTDNLAIDRVEFYHNGQLIGVDQEWPFGFEFPIENTGIESFTATAFDQVGNSASSQIEVEIIRSGG